MPPSFIPRRTLLLALAAALACGAPTQDPAPLRIAVLMPPIPGATEPERPVLEWAREAVNAAGGPAGRRLEFDYYDPAAGDLTVVGEQLATDERYVAVIAGGSADLQTVADSFVAHQRPLVSPLSTSDDLLRAYGGKGAIWRTRESDIAQTELLVRFAHGGGATRIALLGSLGVGGYTFFSWFGFFAGELGFGEDAVDVVALPERQPCQDAVFTALASMPEILFVAASSPEEQQCVIEALPPPDQPRPRVVFADTGLDPYAIAAFGDRARGVEGFLGAADDAFIAAHAEREPGLDIAPHAASEYDAVLLLAYGLEVSGGEGGPALIDALKEAVDGDGANPHRWDDEGVAATLEALRAGDRPRLHGATGPLQFEPDLYMDLTAYKYTHWQFDDSGFELGERFDTGDPTFLSSAGAFVRPNHAPPIDDSTWTPDHDRTDTWALIAALSPAWSNYRHQADALQQYRLLRAGGVDDDHIILVLADDLADSPENPLAGVVRNDPEGVDLYEDLEIDYDISLAADDLANILTGTATAATPRVLMTGPGSNLYVYLAGHGGTDGIPLQADSPESGLAGGDGTFSPAALRQSLCALQAAQRLRRGLVVIESCFSGAFGDAAFDGLELGCGADGTPVDGVLLLTAANTLEVSYAGEYDDQLAAWVNDAFSRRLAETALASPDISLADLYTDVYRGTAGSHPSIYNGERAGRLSMVSLREFFSP